MEELQKRQFIKKGDQKKPKITGKKFPVIFGYLKSSFLKSLQELASYAPKELGRAWKENHFQEIISSKELASYAPKELGRAWKENHLQEIISSEELGRYAPKELGRGC